MPHQPLADVMVVSAWWRDGGVGVHGVHGVRAWNVYRFSEGNGVGITYILYQRATRKYKIAKLSGKSRKNVSWNVQAWSRRRLRVIPAPLCQRVANPLFLFDDVF
jgi:hypothetical protein